MPSGLAALLDDVAGIAKLAAASLDDVGAAAGKAGSKAVGVVVDDAAVTPGYAMGFTPDRELPIVWKIAVGSLSQQVPVPAAGGLAAERLRALGGDADPDAGRGLPLLRGHREDHRGLQRPHEVGEPGADRGAGPELARSSRPRRWPARSAPT
jgi:hypothetical protein